MIMVKKILFFGGILSLLIVSCSRTTITFQNPSGIERNDELIILKKQFIEDRFHGKSRLWPVFLVNGQYLPSQVDDTNGDGEWDEVSVLAGFAPEEKKSVTVRFMEKNSYPVFEKRTNLRLGIAQDDGSYKEVDDYDALPCTSEFRIIAQGESVSWENDKIAFRNYFDCRNVKDLFGKLKPGMIIDKIHTPDIPDYHVLSDWGMDVLHCGNSLGSGGVALLLNDSLYRLGSTDVYRYHKVAEGPLRSVFDLVYKGWHVGDAAPEATERISIYPGKYWFASDVSVTGAPEGAQIVTGIVTTRLKKEPFAFTGNNFQCIGTHDVQSLNNDELGMAVLVPEDEAGKIGRTSGINFFEKGYRTVIEKGFSNIISDTYYIGQKFSDKVPARHYFFAVWGLENEQWKTEEGFRTYIESEAGKLSDPVKIY